MEKVVSGTRETLPRTAPPASCDKEKWDNCKDLTRLPIKEGDEKDAGKSQESDKPKPNKSPEVGIDMVEMLNPIIQGGRNYYTGIANRFLVRSPDTSSYFLE